MEEVWKDIEGYEGCYQVSNMGRVRSLERKDRMGRLVKGKYIKLKDNKYGYKRLILYKNGKEENCMVHRLVAMAFIPNPDNKPCVDHINTIRSDNRASNLRWVTVIENNNNPITKKRNQKTLEVMHEKTRKAVVGIDDKGNVLTFDSTYDAEKKGYFSQDVSECCRGGRLKTYKGYYWTYLEDIDYVYFKED